MTTLPASQGVLGEADLLRIIISALPSRSLGVVRRVSRFWRDLCNEQAVQHARCLPTLPPHDLEVLTGEEYIRRYASGLQAGAAAAGSLARADDASSKARLSLRKSALGALYGPAKELEFNPCLGPEISIKSHRLHQMLGLQSVSFAVPDLRDPKMIKHENEQVAEPPISTMELKMWKVGSRVCNTCTVKVETGLKVGDVYGAYAAMMEGEKRYVGIGDPRWEQAEVECEGKVMVNVVKDMVVVINDSGKRR